MQIPLGRIYRNVFFIKVSLTTRSLRFCALAPVSALLYLLWRRKKMKMYKLLSVLLIVCMLAAMFAGCDSVNTLVNDSPNTHEETTPDTNERTTPGTNEGTTPDTNEGTTSDTNEGTTPDTNGGSIPSIPANANTNPNTTDKYQGITVTKLPYASSGLIINSISYSGTKVTVTVTNNSGYAIASYSSFSYKCYDSNGTILKTGTLYLEDMNNGETAKVYFYAENGTSKILFGEADVRRGNSSSNQETAVYNGITVTKLPYESNGLKITNISFSGTKVTVTVTNNSGYAIASYSSFSYKCYDSNGTILKTGTLYLEDMNNGETAEVYFYAENGTSKILFGEADVRKQ